MSLLKSRLYGACLIGDEETARYLLSTSWGMCLSQENINSFRFTPARHSLLHAACYSGNSNLVHLLCSAGARVNAVDKDSQTPLHIAALTQRDHMIQPLVDWQADVHATDPNGFTPLHLAVIKKNTSAVRKLLSCGAQMLKDKDAHTPMFFACRNKNATIAELLIKGKTVIYGCENILNLWEAVKRPGSPTTALTLLAHCKEVTTRTELLYQCLCLAFHVQGQTLEALTVVNIVKDCPMLLPDVLQDLLKIACKFGDLEIVDFLTIHGADVNATHPEGCLLHFASSRGQEPVVRMLLRRGADPNTRDDNGRTPLYLAALSGAPKTMTTLLEYGADVDAAERLHSMTPIHLVCGQDATKALNVLLRHNADLNVKDDFDQTPLSLALSNGDKRIRDAVKKHVNQKVRAKHKCTNPSKV